MTLRAPDDAHRWTGETMLAVGGRRYRVAMGTGRGAQRMHNEDSVLADQRSNAVVVLDGMGRFAEAAAAVSVAGDILIEELAERTADDAARLRGAFDTADARIRAAGKLDPRSDGAVAAVVAALIGPSGATFAHVGDCRAYLWRAGVLTLLTADHSLERHMREIGRPDEEIARAVVSFRKVMTQALGAGRALNPDVSSCALHPGDRLVLATDGVTDVADAEDLTRRFAGDPASAVDSILADVAERGADNAALAVVDVLDGHGEA